MAKRKLITCISASIMLLALMFTMASCSLLPLSGTYVSKDELVESKVTFKKDNKIEMSAFGIDIEGEYEIDGDELIITYDVFGQEFDMTSSFERDGKSVIIDDVEFVKE